MNILQAVTDPSLFGRAFRRPETWAAWFTFLRAMFALPLSEADLELFRRCTGRTDAPSAPFRFISLVVGRRGGKSFMLAVIAVFLALFRDYRPYLQAGERATILIVAADRGQAKRILGYIGGLLMSAKLLAGEIERPSAESIELRNGVTIEVGTASHRTIRGVTIAAAILDEVAFWRADDTYANPDIEVLAALKPGLASIPGSVMICASSPYAQRGVLWDAYRKHFGVNDSSHLVWQARTRDMNPCIPQDEIDTALAEDYPRYSAEFLAQFRTGLASYVDRETVERCITGGTKERPPQDGITYHAFADAAGGSGQDSFTLCIGHREGKQVVIDLVRETRPKFNPRAVVESYAATLRQYRIGSVTSDRYASGFSAELWRNHGIGHRPSEKPASDLYADTLPAINSQSVTLLDLPRLVDQLCCLERRTSASGKDQITHPTRGHDDVANCVAGLVSVLSSRPEALPLNMLVGRYGVGASDPYADFNPLVGSYSYGG